MRMRHAAVLAGLALGLTSGAARADTLEYNVFVPLLAGTTGTISGTIDTNATPGPLTQSDIISYDLFFGNNEVSSINGGRLSIFGNDFFAVGNTLNFYFNGNDNNEVSFRSGSNFINFISGGGGNAPFYFATNGDDFNSSNDVLPGTVLTIGTSEGSVISTVPLPASAPMFGAALVALAGVGYGVKRKKAAAAA